MIKTYRCHTEKLSDGQVSKPNSDIRNCAGLLTLTDLVREAFISKDKVRLDLNIPDSREKSVWMIVVRDEIMITDAFSRIS